MGDDRDPFASGFGRTLGNLFGTITGRIFVGAATVIGATAVGTNLGAPDRFTGAQGDRLESRIAILEEGKKRHDLEHKTIEARLEQIRTTCTNHRLLKYHETAGDLLEDYKEQLEKLTDKINDMPSAHTHQFRFPINGED